jgi:hypothetical protein
MVVCGFDSPQKPRFQGEGPGPAQRRASTEILASLARPAGGMLYEAGQEARPGSPDE